MRRYICAVGRPFVHVYAGDHPYFPGCGMTLCGIAIDWKYNPKLYSLEDEKPPDAELCLVCKKETEK